MKKSAAFLAMVMATPLYANSWVGKVEDGVLQASISKDDNNQILVLCDAGINAPITSINFVVGDTAPAPKSTVMMQFDKAEPIYAATDEEGGIGILSDEDAKQFAKVLKLLKTKNRVKVRLFNGAEVSFRLAGATKAIGNSCTS